MHSWSDSCIYETWLIHMCTTCVALRLPARHVVVCTHDETPFLKSRPNEYECTVSFFFPTVRFFCKCILIFCWPVWVEVKMNLRVFDFFGVMAVETQCMYLWQFDFWCSRIAFKMEAKMNLKVFNDYGVFFSDLRRKPRRNWNSSITLELQK